MCLQFFFWGLLISTPGTHFPRAVREPPRRFASAGSPLDSLFPQESRTFHSNQLCFNSKIELLLPTVFLRDLLISTPGTRFPRAVREPPRRFASAGSPLDSFFPQESRTFHSNQLCFNSKIELLLPTVFLRDC